VNATCATNPAVASNPLTGFCGSSTVFSAMLPSRPPSTAAAATSTCWSTAVKTASAVVMNATGCWPVAGRVSSDPHPAGMVTRLVSARSARVMRMDPTAAIAALRST
jgi:hypothetical protein